MNTPSKADDIIDSRDIIALIETLEQERESLVEAIDEAAEDSGDNSQARRDLDEFDANEDGEQLVILKELADQASESPDWKYGEALIRDTHFKDYARELADRCRRRCKDDNSWPQRCIDWDQAADELLQDYSAVKFDDVTYWIRN